MCPLGRENGNHDERRGGYGAGHEAPPGSAQQDMVKIAWKVINGYGPYAYLQDTLKAGGKVVSKHLAYLGKAGAGGLFPGKYFQAAAVAGFPGGAVRVPMVPDETLGALKPNPKSSVEWIAAQVLQGVPRKEITLKEPGKTAPAQSKPAWQPQISSYYKDLKVTGGPEAEQGEPAISAPDALKLEKAAAAGDPKKLKSVIKEMTEGVRHMQKKAAVLNAGSELLTQVQEHAKAAQKGKQAPLDTPPAQGKQTEWTPVISPQSKQLKDEEGKPLIAKANIKKLEEAAATGDANHLMAAVGQIAAKMENPHKNVLADMGNDLFHQVQEHAKATQGKAAEAAQQASTTKVAPNYKLKAVPKDAQGEHLISEPKIAKLEEAAASGDPMKLQLAVSQIAVLAPDEEKTQAVYAAGGDLLAQMQGTPPPAAEKPAQPSQPQPPEFKVTEVPKDAKGKPLITKANIKKLEKAAATGDITHLHVIAVGLSDMMKAAAKKKAISTVFGELKDQHDAHEKEKAAAGTAQQATATEVAPNFKVKTVPKDAQGEPLITKANIKKLEEAAATGKHAQLHMVATGLVDMTKSPAEKAAVIEAYVELKDQHYAHVKEIYQSGEKLTPAGPPTPTDQAPGAEVAPNFKVKTVPKDAQGKPLITKANIAKLEEAAASGDSGAVIMAAGFLMEETKPQAKKQALFAVQQDLLGQLHAHKKDEQGKLAGLLAQLQAKKAEEKPAWTKLENAKGSTKGGVYENHKGEKFYLKCPPTPKHVQNELLARDLYKLAGLKVLDGEATELDGETCLASRWNDGLKGSGTNPKDLKGTKEGFAADAWLANWDSVGVGTSKYDNILDLDGEAVRVDTGGALLYRGTGGEKGTAFGLEVTEMEGLRDPKLNPVSAAVYGDMTLDEVQASAEKVLEIDAGDIVKAVHNRFPDAAEAGKLATQLLVRRNNISVWLSKEVTQAQIAEEKDVLVEEVKEESAAPNAEPLSATPKVGAVPKDNKGKALVSAANVKMLEKAAATGNIDTLNEAAESITAKLLSPAKKAAVLNACAELKAQLQGTPVMEGDGGSGLPDTMEKVESGEVELPAQSVPKAKVVAQQAQALKQGAKDYDADLEQVSGKKGSNEGGLFKDKKLETLHYIKWPNSPARAKVEALTALLYGYAQVPVPLVRTIEFQNKDAVMSGWIDEAAPMTEAQMKKHKDVREGFAVDAWLANWDVVGLAADNIVSGPGKKAYRIDLGGSMLFRAQGKPKEFSGDVGELETLRDPAVNAQAAKVFEAMTPKELKASAVKVEAVTDMQIDDAVDSMQLPTTSKDYPASQFGEIAKDLPKMLKTRLKDRRDFIVEDLLRSAEEQEATAQEFQEATDLKAGSVAHLSAVLPKYSSHSPSSSIKWDNTKAVMVQELGKSKGASANAQTKTHYKGWKGSSHSPKGQVLRWAAGEMQGEGRRAMKRLLKFNDFLVKRGTMGKDAAQSQKKLLEEESTKKTAQNLVAGLRVAKKQNKMGHSLQHPGKKEITLYRGWKADQLEYLKANGLKVGDSWELDDPPLYSWSTSPNVAKSFSGHHGSKVTRAQVPLDALVLSDLVNSIGAYESETEAIFKGVPKLKMEVTQTF